MKDTHGVNPKDTLGMKKVNTYLMPPLAVMYGAHAMMDGAVKYGPYNWRDKAVIASVYITAADRHIKLWQSKEEQADDSGVHHLGHAIACLAILIDAQAEKCLKDDRVYSPGVITAIKALNDAIGAKIENQSKGTLGEIQLELPGIFSGGGTVGE